MSKSYWEPEYAYKESKYYKLFQEEKKQIVNKYPQHIFDDKHRPYTKEDRELHLQYLKELADVIFTPDGNYQKFSWDIMTDVQKEEMEKIARGRLSGTGEYS